MECHRRLLIWFRPLRPYLLGATSRRHSSVGLWSRGQHHGQDTTTRHLFLGTRSFWGPSCRFSTKQTSDWKRTVGSRPLNQSLPCTHTMMMTRLDLQHSSSGVPRVRGGTTTWPCFLLALGFLGMSSRKLLEHTIFL